jgi:hypothetical protein
MQITETWCTKHIDPSQCPCAFQARAASLPHRCNHCGIGTFFPGCSTFAQRFDGTWEAAQGGLKSSLFGGCAPEANIPQEPSNWRDFGLISKETAP